MLDANRRPELIAVTLESLKRVPQVGPDKKMCKSARLRGLSEGGNLAFTVETSPLASQQAAQFEKLKNHGFTMVEASAEWRAGFASEAEWRLAVVLKAVDKVEEIEFRENLAGLRSSYDAELADSILVLLDASWPEPLHMAAVKYALHDEPSDLHLAVAVHALRQDELILCDEVALHGQDPFTGHLAITAQGRTRAEQLRHSKAVPTTDTSFANAAPADANDDWWKVIEATLHDEQTPHPAPMHLRW